MTISKEKGCEGCGQCCKEGGPALHRQDLALVRNGQIPTSKLITIRKGELVHNPLSGSLQPGAVELVKIAGVGRQWVCCYYNTTKGCTIYENRPQACRALKCWDTEEIFKLIEKNTLNRFDILPEDHFLLATIREHERSFPCQDLLHLQNAGRDISRKIKKNFEDRAQEEMQFRLRVVAEFQLALCDELFYFGRPYFQLLQALGVRVSETSTGIRLHWSP